MVLVQRSNPPGAVISLFLTRGKNLADHFTKHHTPPHIDTTTLKFFHCTEQLSHAFINHLVLGCVSLVATQTSVCTRMLCVYMRSPIIHLRTPIPYTELCPHKVARNAKPNIFPEPKNWISKVSH